MATTGTYNYNPVTSNLALVSFSRIGLRRAAITSQHMADAENEINLLQVEMSNKQPNLWRGQTYDRELTSGQAAYIMPEQIIAIAAAYLTTEIGGTSTDRILWPLSTFEYAALPDKTTSGPPTSYWYNRQSTPQITFWPVPDDTATYTINLRVFSQIEDATLVSGVNLDMPYRFLDVFVAGLAYRMARLYAKDQEAMRKVDYQESWANAATEDVEDVPLYISVDTTSYWR